MRYITKRLTQSESATVSEVDIVIFQSLDLEYAECNRSEHDAGSRILYYLKNDIDISLMSQSFLNLFDIVELSAEEAIQFVADANVDYEVFLDDNGLFYMESILPEDVDEHEFIVNGRKPVYRKNPATQGLEEFHDE